MTTPLIRTDRRVFSIPATDTAAAGVEGGIVDGSWIDVDGPVAGALTIEWRALSSTEFIELSTIAKMKATLALRAEDVDPDAEVETEPIPDSPDEKRPVTALQKLERTLIVGLTARRSIVAVHNAPAELAAHLSVPSRVVGTLAPGLTLEHGNRVIRATLSPDPFVRAASGR